MRRKRRQISIILFILLLLSFLLLLGDTLLNEKGKRIYNISVITRGKNSESLMIMKQGIDQAALEMDANVSFITMSEENSVLKQTEIMERELKNKVDAIIIDPVDYEKMAEPIEKAMKKIPVILIESKVDSKMVSPSISCDNYKLGASLGEEIIRMRNEKINIVLIENNLECSSIKDKYDGFMSIMKNTDNTIMPIEFLGEKQGDYYNKAKNLLEKNNVDVIVTFDPDILESIGEAKKALTTINKKKIEVEIYGTGSTSKIISFLEDKVISATAIQNEFNIGYLGVKTAVDRINGKSVSNSNISSTVINTTNMYSENNQRLLFPFIR